MNDHHFDYRLDHSERDTMRELTPDEAKLFYVNRLCPFCPTPASAFVGGPRGGFMQNVECPTCRCRLNVLDPQRGIMYGFGQLIRYPALFRQ